MQVAEIVNVKNITSYYNQSTAMAFVQQAGIGYSKWKMCYPPRTCRAYSFNWVADSKYNAGGISPFAGITKPKKFGKIFLFYSSLNSPEEIEQKLKFLHKHEKEAGVSLTKVVQCKVNQKNNLPDGYIFIGDKAWTSNIWKTSFYSYLLKKAIFGATEYDNYITAGRKEKLLSKVKTCFEEKLITNYSGVLVASETAVNYYAGFVEICKGQTNPYMTKLLLGDK